MSDAAKVAQRLPVWDVRHDEFAQPLSAIAFAAAADALAQLSLRVAAQAMAATGCGQPIQAGTLERCLREMRGSLSHLEARMRPSPGGRDADYSAGCLPKPGTYRHHEGGYYHLAWLARHEDDGEWMCCYAKAGTLERYVCRASEWSRPVDAGGTPRYSPV
jgi:hypothetical protein